MIGVSGMPQSDQRLHVLLEDAFKCLSYFPAFSKNLSIILVKCYHQSAANRESDLAVSQTAFEEWNHPSHNRHRCITIPSLPPSTPLPQTHTSEMSGWEVRFVYLSIYHDQPRVCTCVRHRHASMEVQKSASLLPHMGGMRVPLQIVEWIYARCPPDCVLPSRGTTVARLQLFTPLRYSCMHTHACTCINKPKQASLTPQRPFEADWPLWHLRQTVAGFGRQKSFKSLLVLFEKADWENRLTCPFLWVI